MEDLIKVMARQPMHPGRRKVLMQLSALDLIGIVAVTKIQLLYRCFSDCHGKGANIAYDIEPMGKLSLNLGTLR